MPNGVNFDYATFSEIITSVHKLRCNLQRGTFLTLDESPIPAIS